MKKTITKAEVMARIFAMGIASTGEKNLVIAGNAWLGREKRLLNLAEAIKSRRRATVRGLKKVLSLFGERDEIPVRKIRGHLESNRTRVQVWTVYDERVMISNRPTTVLGVVEVELGKTPEEVINESWGWRTEVRV